MGMARPYLNALIPGKNVRVSTAKSPVGEQ